MKNFLKTTYQKIVELLFPSNYKCMFCGRDIDSESDVPYCEDCAKEMPFNLGKHCKICDVPVGEDDEVCDHCKDHHKAFDRGYAPMLYKDRVRGLVLKFKNDNGKYLAPKFAKIIYDYIKQKALSFDVIVPVPLSEKSHKKRGYNQSALIARELSALCNVPYSETALAKVKETKHQKELGFSDRQRNLHGAFKVANKAEVFGKNVLLVDDVITTCATVNECCEVLKRYCNNVYVVGFARSELKNK